MKAFINMFLGCLAVGSEAVVVSRTPQPESHLLESRDSLSRMPQGAWDSHLHVVNPKEFPLSPDATYTPSVNTVWDNAIFEHSINSEHVTIIQPSIYGYDNTMVIDALRAYGPDRARGVVVFDPNNITSTTLGEWHILGARGIRVNLVTIGANLTSAQLTNIINQYADIIRPFGWVLDLYIEMAKIPAIADIIPYLGVTVCFDHFGHPVIPKTSDPESLDPYSLQGFGSLIDLLEGNNTYVKLSAAYRLSNLDDPTWPDLDPLAKEFFKKGSKRTVWATDWPHVKTEGTNTGPWTEHILDMTEGDDNLRQRVFRDNARNLWGAGGMCT